MVFRWLVGSLDGLLIDRFPLPMITVKMMDVFKTLCEFIYSAYSILNCSAIDSYCKTNFVFGRLDVNPGMCISVEKAVELDAKRNVQSTFSSDVYRQPVLTEPTIVEPGMRRDYFVSASSLVDGTKIADSGKIV